MRISRKWNATMWCQRSEKVWIFVYCKTTSKCSYFNVYVLEWLYTCLVVRSNARTCIYLWFAYYLCSLWRTRPFKRPYCPRYITCIINTPAFQIPKVRFKWESLCSVYASCIYYRHVMLLVNSKLLCYDWVNSLCVWRWNFEFFYATQTTFTSKGVL